MQFDCKANPHAAIHTLDLNKPTGANTLAECYAENWKLKKGKREVISNYVDAGVRDEVSVGVQKKKMVECWWTFEHFYMPEGIPLTTLIKVIIGAIGACQMPSLPSQLPRSPWTQLHASLWGLDGRREGKLRWGPGISSEGWRGRGGSIWKMSTPSICLGMQKVATYSPNYNLCILLPCRVAQVWKKKKKKLQWLFCTLPDGWGQSHQWRPHIVSVTLSISMSWRLDWR